MQNSKLARSIKLVMPLRRFKFIIIALVLTSGSTLYAIAPKVGRLAAAKYFQKNPDEKEKNIRYLASEEGGLSADERYLAFGASVFTKSDAFSWGDVNKEQDVGKLGFDMTYRLSESNYIDYALRVLYTEYEPLKQKANKMSFMYAILLPDAGSKFPLYFGAAAGPGVFFTQLSNESRVTLDYQLFLGFRIFNLFDSTGFYIEGGMKNHLQLTSDGQLNGTYLAGGAIFTF